MNETLNKFLTVMSNIEAAKSVAPPPPVSPPLVTTCKGNPNSLDEQLCSQDLVRGNPK
jgi:hypothetical protein